jgi:hypothetical protein
MPRTWVSIEKRLDIHVVEFFHLEVRIYGMNLLQCEGVRSD